MTENENRIEENSIHENELEQILKEYNAADEEPEATSSDEEEEITEEAALIDSEFESEINLTNPEGEFKEKAAEYAQENSAKIKKRKKVNFVYDAIIGLCIIVFCVSAFFLGRWLWQNYKTKAVTDNAMEVAGVENSKVDTEVGKVIAGMDGDDGEDSFSYLDLNMEELYARNSDTVGWIRVNGTMVDYPVVQCNNNDYYLTRDFEENYTDAGCPFLDYRNNASDIAANRNFIIYGHARKDRSIFGSLDFCRQSWWQNEDSFHLIRYTSMNQKTVWRIFSAYTINVEDYYYIQTDFGTAEEFELFVNDLRSFSEYNFGVDVGAGDTIMTLSTCAYNGDDRLVVHAKLIQAEEYNNETIEDSVTVEDSASEE